MSDAMSGRDLLEAAHDLVVRPSAELAGLWPRAAAVLGRQALESQVTIILTKWVPGIYESNMRTKMICLRARLPDKELAERASHAYWALSNACHYRSYELPPTANELEQWLATVDELVDYQPNSARG